MSTESPLRVMTWVPRAFALLALAALSAGCAPTLAVVETHDRSAIVADPRKAIVVIAQPSSRLRAVNIIDGHGQLVGQLDERSHVVLRASEGPNLFYAALGALPSSADRLEGTLIAGRVYYATVSERPGGVELLALTPRSPEGRWTHRNDYVATTPRLQIDPEKIGRAVNELGNLLPVMEAADARVASLQPDQQAEHQFQESDGF